MLLALKLLVVVGVLSYALAAVLSERELVVHGHHPYPAGRGGGLCFQQPLSHWVRRPRQQQQQQQPGKEGEHGCGQAALGATHGDQELLGRRTCRIQSTLYSKRQQGPLLQRSLRHRPPSLEAGQEGKVITTVAGLRTKHGEGSFWGDLNHVETRLVYHQLLPRHLLQDAQAHADQIPVEDLARLASTARHAARLYARERSSLPLRVLAGLYDGFRHLHTFGRWSWTGMTYEEVWAKYEAKVKEELQQQGKVVLDDPSNASASSVSTNKASGSNKRAVVHRRELNRLVALRILEKSCETNPGFDRFARVERAKAALLQAQAQAEQQAEAEQKRSSLGRIKGGAVDVDVDVEGKGSGGGGVWAAKSSPLFPLLDHFARLAKNTRV